jgi:tetratricopeptide (TPR) repeat protein
LSPFSLSIQLVLGMVRGLRNDHGLLHGNYLAYRRFCTRRLHRMRKVTKTTLGRGKYAAAKAISKEAVEKDPRLVLVTLMQAERAWAHAMQLRDDADAQTGRNPLRVRIHATRKLRKATRYAVALSEQASDLPVAQQTQAYASGMSALLYIQQQRWEDALLALQQAKQAYAVLKTVSLMDIDGLLRLAASECGRDVQQVLGQMSDVEMSQAETVSAKPTSAEVRTAQPQKEEVVVDKNAAIEKLLAVVRVSSRTPQKTRIWGAVPLEPTPVRPIVFDLASEMIHYPGISGADAGTSPEAPKKAGGLFGWFSRS